MEWAKGHVDFLRDAIGELADGELHPIPTWRQYEPERSSVVYRVGPGPKVPKHAGLIVGDAVQNFRACLNYAAWQLAFDALGRVPTQVEARDIQFPILRPDKAASWGNHPHRRFMSKDAARAIKKFQPFNLETSGDLARANLRLLAELSNDDKHKILQVAVLARIQAQFTVPADTTDCTLAREGSMGVPNLCVTSGEELHEGDEVAWIRVVPTGPNPDVDLQPKLSGKAILGKPTEALPVVPVLDAIGVTCARILGKLEPLMK